MTPAMRILLLGGRPFSPSVLYTGGQAGIWLDQSDSATAWQESTKVTAGALNSPVGYRSSKGGNVAGVLQATAAARPTWSQRKNLLTYSEQFDNAAWSKLGVTVAANSIAAPDGTTTADTLTEDTANTRHIVYMPPGVGAITQTHSVYAKAGTRSRVILKVDSTIGGNKAAIFNLSTGAVGNSANCTPSIVDVGGGWYRCSISCTPSSASTNVHIGLANSDTFDGSNESTYLGDGSTAYIWGAQLEIGSTLTSYQRIAAATDYATAGFPYWDVDDGIDDNWAATFAAGTLINGMSAFLALQRTSAAGIVAGFRAAGSANYFGAAASGGAGAASALSGTLTHWVNGVQVPGGTATTEAQLHTAMPVGTPLILEARGLDLSAWEGYGQGYFSGGYPGAVKKGGTIICPTPSEARAAQIRRWLANKIGATTI